MVLAVALLLAAPALVLNCQPAEAAPLRSTQAQGSGLLDSPGMKALESALGTEPGAGQAAELSSALLSSRESAASPYDKSLAGLTVSLLSPSVRGAIDAVASHRQLAPGQRKVLRQAVGMIVRNRAVRQLEARGARLKRNPAALRGAISALIKRLAGQKFDPGGQTAQPALSESAESPFLEIERALSDPAQGVEGKPLTAALRKLLTSPDAFRRFKSWSPFSLAMFLDQQPQRSPFALPSSDGAADPDCTIADTEAMIYVASSVGKAVTDWAIGKLTSTTLVGSIRMPNGRSIQKTLNKQLGRQEPAWARVLSYIPFLKQGDQVGKSVMAARYWAAVRCYAKRIGLVPSKMTRAAGEHQLYNLLAYNTKGREIAAVPPDLMQMDDGTCTQGYPDWECFSTVAGPHPLLARFGDLPPARDTLTVTPGPLSTLDLQPKQSNAGIEAGVNEHTDRFTVSGEDEFGNKIPVEIGPLSREAHLSIAPEGGCEDTFAYCIAYETGPHEVAVSFQGHRAVATVEIHPNKLNLQPGTARVPVGQAQKYEADEWTWGGRLLRTNIPFGTANNQAHLTLSPSQVGSCDEAAATCTIERLDGPGTHAYLVRATTEKEQAVGSAVLEAEENPAIKWSGRVTVNVTAHEVWGTLPNFTDEYESQASLDVATAAPFEQTEAVSYGGDQYGHGSSSFETGTAHWLGYTGTFRGFFDHIAGPEYPSCYWFHRNWDATGSATLPVSRSTSEWPEGPTPGFGIVMFPTYFVVLMSGPSIESTTFERPPYHCGEPLGEAGPEDRRWRLYPDWDDGFMGVPRCSQAAGPFKTPYGGLEFWNSYGLQSSEPLTRVGDRVTGTVSCSWTRPPGEDPWESATQIELDLTARCLSGEVPDEKWRCDG